MVRDTQVTAYQDKLSKLAKNSFPSIVFPTGRLSLSIYWHRKENDGRRRDADNIQKALKDSLNKIIWDDDSQVSEIYLAPDYDAKEEEWLDIVIQYDPTQPLPIQKRSTTSLMTLPGNKRSSTEKKRVNRESISSAVPSVPS